MLEKIRKALETAGYNSEPTTDNLIDCYLDYVSAFGGCTEEAREEIEEGSLTLNTMCNRLIRCN